MQPNASSAMTQPLLRRVVAGVALANAAYFFVEFFVARKIGSVSLFADSIDFLEDAALNFLIFAALGWSVRNRARAGMVLAAILLVPALALLWTAWQKFNAPTPPEPWLLSGTGLGAIAIILAGLVTLFWRSGWPDLLVGLGIAIVNADAAKEVWLAARDEHRSAQT
ncbi:MAG: cation transporter [Burkholderia sp.]|nr:cation transporter [Burkholderia sp.]